MLADGFTRALGPTRFREHFAAMGLVQFAQDHELRGGLPEAIYNLEHITKRLTHPLIHFFIALSEHCPGSLNADEIVDWWVIQKSISVVPKDFMRLHVQLEELKVSDIGDARLVLPLISLK
ncbi:hypothetical protein GN958_ATG13425 [Phytophthora infestans]|uniref:Uncharacterized protein n=1 Tax=Phytophthora infestans TaxID=4787 RepID=A0A8S9UG50_PHYIN|nr:hypothetical protein GN958_ATG13425 [Phytophthora infestans]